METETPLVALFGTIQTETRWKGAKLPTIESTQSFLKTSDSLSPSNNDGPISLFLHDGAVSTVHSCLCAPVASAKTKRVRTNVTPYIAESELFEGQFQVTRLT